MGTGVQTFFDTLSDPKTIIPVYFDPKENTVGETVGELSWYFDFQDGGRLPSWIC